jgi:hypothetical protein
MDNEYKARKLWLEKKYGTDIVEQTNPARGMDLRDEFMALEGKFKLSGPQRLTPELLFFAAACAQFLMPDRVIAAVKRLNPLNLGLHSARYEGINGDGSLVAPHVPNLQYVLSWIYCVTWDIVVAEKTEELDLPDRYYVPDPPTDAHRTWIAEQRKKMEAVHPWLRRRA